MSVPPFLSKTFDIVSDEDTNNIISWAPGGDSFVVWNPPEFSKVLLPQHFKHNNFSSFVRQLNTYGFKKVDPDRWEFMNVNFKLGRPDLLSNIQRRKGQTAQQSQHSTALVAGGQSAIEVGQYGGLLEEVETLKRDKNVLMMELVSMRQKQQEAEIGMSDMRHRLDHTEQRLSQLITFFSQIAKNPSVLAHMVSTAQNTTAYLQGSDARRKKRRAEDTDDPPMAADESGSIIPYQPNDISNFFQNLLAPPLSTPPRTSPAHAAAHDLEAHFNNFNLSSEPPTKGYEIHEYEPANSGSVAQEDPEPDNGGIHVPDGIMAGVPKMDLKQTTGEQSAPSAPEPRPSDGNEDALMASVKTEPPFPPETSEGAAAGLNPPSNPLMPTARDSLSLDDFADFDLSLPNDDLNLNLEPDQMRELFANLQSNDALPSMSWGSAQE